MYASVNLNANKKQRKNLNQLDGSIYRLRMNNKSTNKENVLLKPDF